jgi:hypothetical protein
MLNRKNGRSPKDEGVALVAVMVSIAVISSFLLVSLQYGLANSTAGRKDQDAKIATSAAQAGLDEYLARLNANPTYYSLGNNDAGNLAFSAAGRAIQGTTTGAAYHYEVLNSVSDFINTGIVRLQVTGMSRGVSRTLTANLKTKSFTSNIYFSDYESSDPVLAGTTGNANCYKHYWEGRSSTGGACGEIQWGASDTVKGPLHSNDALQINGAVNYTAVAETGCPAAQPAAPAAQYSYICPPPKTWWGTAAAGSLPLNVPTTAQSIALPDENSTLATRTTPGADGAQTGTGCYYTGATRITFTGTTMSVLSPSTTAANTPTRCLVVSNRANEQTNLAIPPVIYVDGTVNTCTYKNLGYPVTGESVTVGGADDVYWTSTGTNKTTNYRCGRGTAYISGTADAQVTIATSADILITGNLKVNSLSGTNVIGLIATNDIWVYHPITAASANLLTSTDAVTVIQAAVLSVKHSFLVQNWLTATAVGTLNLTGALAQKYRGPVGSGSGTSISTGYGKNYVYDPRLAYLQPPFFLASSSNIWVISSVTDD